MANKFYGVRKGKNVGVYDNWNEASLQVTGFKGAEFKKFGTIEDACSYVGIPTKKVTLNPSCSKNKSEDKKKKKTAQDLFDKYILLRSDRERIQYVSKLDDVNKNKLYSKMSISQRNHYRKIASDLMERRFDAVRKNKDILDYLLINPKGVQYSVLNKKYQDVDISITVYTIKAIINVMGESDFSRDDGSSCYNENAQKYYSICRKYWDSIWWYTDTGILSKNEIAEKNFSEYHKTCNTVRIIAEIRRYLHLLRISNFNKRYKLEELKNSYERELEINKEIKERQKKLAREKKEKDLRLAANKKKLYKYLSNSNLESNVTFEKIAKSMDYSVPRIDNMFYKSLAIDKSILNELSEDNIKVIRERAFWSIESHLGTYHDSSIGEAIRILRNLI